jgi:Tfp pilus assembly protein PilX
MLLPGTNPSTVLRVKSKGQALVITLLIISALLAGGAIFMKIVFSDVSMANLYIQKEKAFYLAEAGLEDGKSMIASNPNWFTDSPHTPADDPGWLINGAKGAVRQFGTGSYKMVRESGKNIIYSVGHSGGGTSVLRVKYNAIPFKAFEFKII